MRLPLLNQEVKGTRIYNPPQVNPCGGCTECCYGVAIEELGKPYFQHCEHQGKSSCRVHDDPSRMPKSCAGYLCIYAAGFIGEEQNVGWRPDHMGFIFQMIKDEKAASMGQDVFVLEVIETRDCSHQAWKKMNIALNEIVLKLKVDAIKFFLFDTNIGTIFHTGYGKPDQYMQGGGDENWKIVMPRGFPPLLFYLRTENTKTKAKLMSLITGFGGGTIATAQGIGIDGLKKLLGVQ